MKNETGKFVSVEKVGREERTVIHWDTKKKYTQEQLEKQREEFETMAKQGHIIDLSSLLANHGM